MLYIYIIYQFVTLKDTLVKFVFIKMVNFMRNFRTVYSPFIHYNMHDNHRSSLSYNQQNALKHINLQQTY